MPHTTSARRPPDGSWPRPRRRLALTARRRSTLLPSDTRHRQLMNNVGVGHVVRRGLQWAHGIFLLTILRPFERVSRLKERINTRVLVCSWVSSWSVCLPRVLFPARRKRNENPTALVKHSDGVERIANHGNFWSLFHPCKSAPPAT